MRPHSFLVAPSRRLVPQPQHYLGRVPGCASISTRSPAPEPSSASVFYPGAAAIAMGSNRRSV
eukprot:3840974-Pyramimonas_sp.AAC.1